MKRIMAGITDGKCGTCRGELRLTLTAALTHYGRYDCDTCGFQGWAPKPQDDPTKYQRPKGTTGLADKDYCEVCLKKEVVLHGHHVIPVKKGGSDEAENIWTVCTACHRLIEWTRTYYGA